MPDESRQPNGFSLFWADTKLLLSFKLPWVERTTLEKAYTGMFTVVLIGLLPMPYEFYVNLRLVVCFCLYFFFQAILPEREQRKWWFAAIVGLLILYNPILPMHTEDKDAWTFLNAVTVYSLYRARFVFDKHVEM